MAERKRGTKLPGRLRIVQTNTRGGFWVTVPKELAEDMRRSPGTILEFRRVGRHLEIHRREELPKGGRNERSA
ncbi:TPA: hypothetical protein DCY65_00010 [Candidatus Acetothermia bacterium]|nr:hypothetical protein [Candidatus Acetothermia bacterium]